MLEDLHEPLAGVTIERLAYADFIRRYDHGGALFYLDPPYWGCEEDYGAGVFARADFERLAEQLAQIRGRFILSINDTAGAREVFGRFDCERVEVTYHIATASTGAGKRRGSLSSGGTDGGIGATAAVRIGTFLPNPHKRWIGSGPTTRRASCEHAAALTHSAATA